MALPETARTVRRRLASSPVGLAALAVLVGIGAGIGAIAFRWLLDVFTTAFTGSRDYSAVAGSPSPLAPSLGPWFLVLVPALGGLLYGPLIDRFAREARGTGVPQVMAAVAVDGGRIRSRVVGVKALASAVCLGSGGSVGREGPIVHVGSALASALGQGLGLGPSDLQLLVCCGAAGGISATFNAPIAGVLFVLELILREFTARSFGIVGLASVTADVVGRLAFGSAPFLAMPPSGEAGSAAYPFYALLGVLAGGAAVAFIRTFEGAELLADRIWRGRPEWLRPAFGGLALGLLLVALPQLYGVGYAPMRTADAGEYAVGFLLLLAAGKIAATSLTIAIGGSGGIFAPTLYVGAMLGAAYGAVAAAMLPGLAGPGEGYALAGMAAVFGAAARAPITAVVIMYELTGDYVAVPPMMLAVTLAAGAAALVETDTLYTLTLKRRGVSDPVAGGWPAPPSVAAAVAGPPLDRIAGARRRAPGAASRSASRSSSRTGNHGREPPGTA
jgi:CIC family chloride channel protein